MLTLHHSFDRRRLGFANAAVSPPHHPLLWFPSSRCWYTQSWLDLTFHTSSRLHEIHVHRKTELLIKANPNAMTPENPDRQIPQIAGALRIHQNTAKTSRLVPDMRSIAPLSSHQQAVTVHGFVQVDAQGRARDSAVQTLHH